jgi:hypothetical protein
VARTQVGSLIRNGHNFLRQRGKRATALVLAVERRERRRCDGCVALCRRTTTPGHRRGSRVRRAVVALTHRALRRRRPRAERPRLAAADAAGARDEQRARRVRQKVAAAVPPAQAAAAAGTACQVKAASPRSAVAVPRRGRGPRLIRIGIAETPRSEASFPQCLSSDTQPRGAFRVCCINLPDHFRPSSRPPGICNSEALLRCWSRYQT